MGYQINVFKDKHELLSNVAESFVSIISTALNTNKQCRIVVGGGRTPVELNRHVVEKCRHTSSDWSGLHIYFSDERMVPQEHPDNTATMICNTLAKPLNLPWENIHSIQTNIGAGAAASAYHRELVELNGNVDGPLFYLSLLGLGPDGHTASLFPNSPALMERGRFATTGGRGPEGLERVTLTLMAIEQSDLIWIIAAGKEKQSAVDRLINGPWDPNSCPAQGINQNSNQVVLWLEKKCIKM